ncbi:unnamed protein product [Bursaphelenchus xylophilus]|uniref:(pine wood nematode) hypothetical protein n=1 Tax=Bursaphelenchus xylophilus TaxID=6326 RepID=A0A7I8X2R5_BURXY|nr:unnamed protein product [Bursaphelenchus xylophilus]CAG9131205.1 unnamed protein product [Bursaphelenchus xylophilus]
MNGGSRPVALRTSDGFEKFDLDDPEDDPWAEELGWFPSEYELEKDITNSEPLRLLLIELRRSESKELIIL